MVVHLTRAPGQPAAAVIRKAYRVRLQLAVQMMNLTTSSGYHRIQVLRCNYWETTLILLLFLEILSVKQYI
ncbi:TPA: hypothetical protein ACQ717_004374, partial [Escherichia coli]